ncbi:MAG: DUF4143 domain-containing protein [Candidatus Methanoplasma sp.]|jgi:predicted AAA+ superfamily ATPase|nr:DUF4143 domain-containing protein [Candidatus Methanoplasma sp.]
MVMTRDGYKPRLVDRLIEDMLKATGAICIEGPKWCGKTWVSLNHAESAIMIGDADNGFQNKRLVEMDVSRAFRGKEPRLIDEWQDIPAIWGATKSEVDNSNATGRFILTGSSTPKSYAKTHSGAGRIGIIKMRTMSLFESGDSDGSVSLRSMFGLERVSTDIRNVDFDRLVDLIIRGGWPNNIGKTIKASQLANRSYLNAIINDASTLDGSNRNRNKIEMLLKSLARNESTLASVSKIASDLKENNDDEDIIENSDSDSSRDKKEGPSQKAARYYLDILDRLFLISNQLAFDPNLRSEMRVGKVPKRHLTDPSVAVAAMGLTHEKLIGDLNTLGFLFESMCERDLDIYASASYGKLYHYRDGRGNELDAVVEMPDGRWGAFEIKLGTNQIDEAAKNLVKIDRIFRDEGARSPEFLCVICGMAAAAYIRPKDGVYVVPITSLRD